MVESKKPPPGKPAPSKAPPGDQPKWTVESKAPPGVSRVVSSKSKASPKTAPAGPRVVLEGRSQVRFPAPTPQMDALPLVSTVDEVRACDGQRVQLVGVYRTADVRMARVGQKVLRGHAIIALEDGHAVALLPIWDDDARRPADESMTMQGKTVRVVGTMWLSAPEDPSGGASPTGPCVDDVEALALN